MSESDDEWRFSVEEVGEESESTTESDDASDESDEYGGSVAGSLSLTDELEPGDPSLENALFVALGALTTVVLVLVMAGVV